MAEEGVGQRAYYSRIVLKYLGEMGIEIEKFDNAIDTTAVLMLFKEHPHGQHIIKFPELVDVVARELAFNVQRRVSVVDNNHRLAIAVWKMLPPDSGWNELWAGLIRFFTGLFSINPPRLNHDPD